MKGGFEFANPIREEFRVSNRRRLTWSSNRTEKRTTHPVIVTQVDTRVWKTAMKLADNDSRRIQIVSKEEVIVRNRPLTRALTEIRPESISIGREGFPFTLTR